MKQQFCLACLSTTLLCAQVIANPSTTAPEQVNFNAGKDYEEYAESIKENISTTALNILTLSTEDMPIQNSIKIWNNLLNQLARDFSVLEKKSQHDLFFHSHAAQALDDLHAYLITVYQYPELQPILARAKNFPWPHQNEECYAHTPITTLDLSHKGQDNNSGGSIEAGVKIEWGGSDGVKYGGSVKGEAHDDKGNHIEGNVTYDFNSKEGSASVNVGTICDRD